MSKQRTHRGFTHKMKHVTGNHTTGAGKKRKNRFTKAFLRISSCFKTAHFIIKLVVKNNDYSGI